MVIWSILVRLGRGELGRDGGRCEAVLCSGGGVEALVMFFQVSFLQVLLFPGMLIEELTR